jgi:dienelactone hydrolase
MVRTHALDEATFATDLSACPVILAGHGWTGSPEGHYERAEALASHGFVVLALDSADAYASLEANGAGIMGTQHRAEPINALHDGRVADALRVIDQLTVWNQDDQVLGGKLMPENIGIFGWSMGGATAIDLAQIHPHCRAAVNLDGGAPSTSILRPNYSKAFLYIGSGVDWNSLWLMREFAESLSRDALYFRIRNTTHSQLAEWHWWGTRQLRVRALTRRAITSFFLKHLKGVDDGFFDVLETEYPEVYDVVRR